MVSEWAGTTRDAIEVRLVLGGVPVMLVDTAGLRQTAEPLEAEGVRRALRHAAQADLVLQLAAPGMGQEMQDVPAADVLRVWNKTDLTGPPPGWLGVSARTGDGIHVLERELGRQVARLTDHGAGPPLTRARHRAGVTEAARHLELGELRGEALRLAMRALGRLTGTVGVEDLLDSVFGEFCIGK